MSTQYRQQQGVKMYRAEPTGGIIGGAEAAGRVCGELGGQRNTGRAPVQAEVHRQHGGEYSQD